MPIKRTITAICDISGAKVNCAPNEVAEDEREIDPEVPPGWVVLVARRVIANPEHAAAEIEREQWLASKRTLLADAPAEQREYLMAEFEDQAPENDEAPYLVQTVEIVLSPSEADKALKRIGMDGWE